MSTYKLSIIIPVYNVEKFLPQCLDSVINQTLKDIEIICVNDGSTDKSLEILTAYARNDKRIKIYNQENQGQSAARNLAISHASGEYLGFVDSDDWVDLDYFEKLYNAAKQFDADIACAGFRRCDKFKKTIRKSFKEVKVYTDINEKVKLDNLPENNYVWNKIYKRSKWDFVFPTGRYFEDVAILIKILYKLGTMVTVPKTYYNYRKNPKSTIKQKTPKHEQDLLWAKSELNTFAEENNITLPLNKSFEKREVIKLFGLTVLKIYYYDHHIEYKLFGFIPFASKNW